MFNLGEDAVLKESLSHIQHDPDRFSAQFYNNLFQDYPQIKPLFAHTDMVKQQRHLIKALVVIVNNIATPDLLKDAIWDLGVRHIKYGAIPNYFPLFGQSLLKTLESYLGAEWTPEVKSAWQLAYQQVANIMIEAGLEASSTRSGNN